MEEKIFEVLEKISSRLDSMENRFDSMDQRFDSLESQVKENTLILRALEHKADVNKAEHDKMMHDISDISGEVKGIRKDLAQVEIITSSNWNEIARLKAVR